MLVSLIGGIASWLFHRIGTWRNYHRSAGAAPDNSLIGRIAIISAIGRELPDWHLYLVKQRLRLRSVAGILIRHDLCDDPAAVGIQRQMQFAPAPPSSGTVLFLQPLASAVDLQP